MTLRTLLGQATPDQLKALPARTRNPERVQQSIDAFALHLQGVSYRGIQEQFGWKSPNTAVNAVQRGEELAKLLNLDGERIRLKLAAFFDEVLDISLAQIRDQVENGQITQVADNQGNTTVTKRRGVDPRLMGEAGRGAIRFAQFVGLMDSDASTGGGEISTNVVFIQPTGDGAAWDQLQTQAPVVDVSVSGQGNGQDQRVITPEPASEQGGPAA